MSSAEIVRTITADPASVALLLSGPVELGARPEHGGLALVGGRPATLPCVTLSAPRRRGVGFCSTIDCDLDDRHATGAVTVAPSRDAGSEVQVVLAAREPVTDRELERWARAFLSDLARRAGARIGAA